MREEQVTMKTTNKYLWRFAVTLFLVFSIPQTTWAWGIIQGTVQNDTGSPISGALIKTPYTSTLSSTNGSYQMFNLPGTFTATISASGYVGQTQQISVIDTQTTPLNFSLTPAPKPLIEKVTPNLGELGNDLNVKINGTAFDDNTRVSMYLDSGNKAKIMGSIATPDNALAVTVIGSTAYIADFASGLQIIDVSNPLEPLIIGSVDTPGSASAVTVIGSIAYVADFDGGLQIIDISDPTQPLIAGFISTPGSARNVTVTGTTAYVADGPAGLQIIDVNDPTQPLIIGSIPGGQTSCVAVIDNIAYVGDDFAGLLVVDVSDPTQPFILGTVQTPGDPKAISVTKNIAYIADYWANSGLVAIDISDPAHPLIIGSVATPDYALAVKVIGNTAYIADFESGLQVIDVSNPVEPLIIGSVDTPNTAYDVSVIGSIAYVADYSGGLQVVDVSNASLPFVIGSVDTNGLAWDLTITENTAYVADRNAGLQVIDVSDPNKPLVIGSVDTPGMAVGLTVIENTAYVADESAGLQIIDVNPSSPNYLTIIGSLDTPGWAEDVTIAGNIAYVADFFSGLQLIDISTPENPVIIGSVDTPGVAFGLTIIGGVAYVADSSGGLQIIDINPSSPNYLTIIGSVGNLGDPRNITVIGNIAYVDDMTTNHLHIIDVGIPENPIIISSFDTGFVTHNVTVIGSTAFVSAGEGLQVIDVSNPLSPTLIGTVNTLKVARAVIVKDNKAFVAVYDAGLVIVPVLEEVTSLTVNSGTEIIATLPSPQIAGNYTIRAFNNVEHSELLGAVTFTENVDLLHARAIIVAGGGSDAPGDIWDETKAYAQEAYNSLIYQGYRSENIYYLTDDATAEGRTGSPDKTNLQYAITDWADDDPATNSLALYMVDHGENEKFQLRGDANPDLSKYVTASELDSWLDTLQTNTGMKVLLAYDACFSGSFMQTLQEPDDTRVIITSTDNDEVAYFLDLKQSFSGVFWGTLSGKTGSQGNLYNAWNLASNNMANYQAAQLDANGNGVTNEPEDVDALEQNIFEIGRQWFNAGFSKPVVNVVATNQTLAGEQNTTLSAWGVYDLDNDNIVRVWAEVTRPDFIPIPDVTVTSLPAVNLIDPDVDGTYAAVFPDDAIETLPGFDVQGTYIITYYAEDSKGVYSEPKFSLVTQTTGAPVNIPDQYEDDDTAVDASVIVINNPSPQAHSFHDTNDKDWAVFYGLSGEVYTIRAMNPTIISDPMINIYSSTNLTTPVVSSNTSGSGVEESIIGWTCPADGIYYVRLTNNSGYFGPNVRYLLKVYNPIALSLPGYITGRITSGGVGVAGAIVRAGGGTAITLADGSFILYLMPGSYSISVSCPGYQPTSYPTSVGSGSHTSLPTLDLNSIPRIINTPPGSVKAYELYSYTPLVVEPDGDSFIFSITGKPVWTNFSTSSGRLWGTPSAGDEGIYGPITIHATDSAGASGSVIFNINVMKGDVGSLPAIYYLLLRP